MSSSVIGMAGTRPSLASGVALNDESPPPIF